MKTYTATYWRSNPQLTNGGYETTRMIEAENKRKAMKIANDISNRTSYGSMTLRDLRETA